jgi:hypothetical protein
MLGLGKPLLYSQRQLFNCGYDRFVNSNVIFTCVIRFRVGVMVQKPNLAIVVFMCICVYNFFGVRTEGTPDTSSVERKGAG